MFFLDTHVQQRHLVRSVFVVHWVGGIIVQLRAHHYCLVEQAHIVQVGSTCSTLEQYNRTSHSVRRYAIACPAKLMYCSTLQDSAAADSKEVVLLLGACLLAGNHLISLKSLLTHTSRPRPRLLLLQDRWVVAADAADRLLQLLLLQYNAVPGGMLGCASACLAGTSCRARYGTKSKIPISASVSCICSVAQTRTVLTRPKRL
jgi:hypothetical protein